MFFLSLNCSLDGDVIGLFLSSVAWNNVLEDLDHRLISVGDPANGNATAAVL